MEEFGSSGLRTLCLAYRDLNPSMYESWNEKFIQAKSALRDREKKLDEVIWFNLIFLSYLPLLILFLLQQLSLCNMLGPIGKKRVTRAFYGVSPA